ncbi:MAG: hypothetical protein ABIG61_11940 [Planctomycetota bacterium]
MNITMQVFTVFFAIFWGFVANVLARWKAFQSVYILKHSQELCRVILSILCFNVIPILYFGWSLCILNNLNFNKSPLTVQEIIKVVFCGVVPAFATFGFYRIWLGFVELRPYLFYLKCTINNVESLQGTYYMYAGPKKKDKVNPNPETGWQNLISGIVYIIVSSVPLFALWSKFI